MNDFSMMVYWLNVLNEVKGFLTFLSGVFLLISIFAWVVFYVNGEIITKHEKQLKEYNEYDESDNKYRKLQKSELDDGNIYWYNFGKHFKKYFWISSTTIVVLSLIPSQEVAKIIIASEMAEDVTKLPEFEKARVKINKWLDEESTENKE